MMANCHWAAIITITIIRDRNLRWRTIMKHLAPCAPWAEVEPFRCIRFPAEPEARSFTAPELSCDFSAYRYLGGTCLGSEATGDVPPRRPPVLARWMNLAMALLWALGVPLFLTNMLRKVRNSALESGGMVSTLWGVYIGR